MGGDAMDKICQQCEAVDHQNGDGVRVSSHREWPDI